MTKLKEMLKEFIETQNKINKTLESLRADLQPKFESLNTCKITVDRIDNYVTSNIYTKEATIETINKEYDYRKEYEQCLKRNEDLLHLVETYCKYNDKYEILKIFKEIDDKYIIQKVSDDNG